MNRTELLHSIKKRFLQNDISSFDASILFFDVLNISKEEFYSDPKKEVSKKIQKKLLKLSEERIVEKKPVSKIIGKKEFFSLDFFVDENVLDPRADSETLVELALEYIKKTNNKNLNILEIGTGSACLIISLIKNIKKTIFGIKKCQGTAIDISSQALKIAKKNIKFHNLENNIELVKSNLFNELKPVKSYDLLISNPPYIPFKEIAGLQQEVFLHDPHLALDGGRDGLNFYSEIAKSSKDFLKARALIILEIGQGQEDQIKTIFLQQSYSFLAEQKDLAGIIRCLVFQNN